MEGNSPVEKRRAMKNVKQYSRSTSRNKLSLESTLPGSDLPKGVALEPVGLRGELSRSPHSVLEGKVKALKEKRVAMKQGGVLSQEHLSPKKTKVKKGKLLSGPAVVEGVTPDAVVEPQAQIRTYLTDVVLDSRDDADCGQHARRAMLRGAWDSNGDSVKGHRTVGEHVALSQSSADVLWRFPTPGSNIMENAEYPESGGSRGSPDGFWDAVLSKNAVSSSRKSSLRENGRPTLPASCGEEMTQATDFESIPFVPRYDSCEAASSGRLWRVDSWDSIGSTGSTASMLSLAERVERNRMMLQEMLSLSGQSRGLQESRTLHRHEGEGSLLAKDGPSHELLVSDVDWDSGVSLQDSEGYRAFVSSQELELSPRHEQAKQLLQRARMKARTSPLRASHDILPAVTQDRRDAGRTTAPDLRKSLALKGGDTHISGNLSDSSSGESSCGQRRKRGPSPSRVRFEDESVRDAEVRYLERLQLRQKRVLDSVLLSLGQSPLVSKPDLSDYINGDFHRKENGVSKAFREQQDHGQTAGASAHMGSPEKATPSVVSAEGKCTACGSYLGSSTTNLAVATEVNRTVNDLSEGNSLTQKNKNIGNLSESRELGTSQQEPKARTLGPGGSPVWILPSRQRIHTERIRETYIGDVTYIDDVDSALDSTDTSDSCKTDSEEAGPGSSQSEGYSETRSRCHSGHKASRGNGTPGKGAIGRKVEQGKCKMDGSGGGGALDDSLGSSRTVFRKDANGDRTPSLKDSLVLKENPGLRSTPNGVEAFSKCEHPPAPPQLAGKNSGQEDAMFAPAQQRKLHLPPPTPHQPSALPAPKADDDLSGNRESGENLAPSHPPTASISQSSRIRVNPQQTKQGVLNYSLAAHIPTPPSTKKASTPMPYRKAVLTGSYRLTNQETGCLDQTNKLVTCSTSPPSNFQHKCESMLEEQKDQQNPKGLSKSKCQALSANNCNNTHTKHQQSGLDESHGQYELSDQKVSGSLGETKGLSSGADPSAAPSTIGSAVVTFSLVSKEPDSAHTTQLPDQKAVGPRLQKAKQLVEGSITPCKPLGTQSEPKKSSSSTASRKGGSSSASGLKKFFSVLSQNTRQKLGRFRCYSMEQLPPEAPGSVQPPEVRSNATESSKMKKSPSLQSLRLMPPFSQPRKASSVQNLHSFLGRTDRSNAYLVVEPEEDKTTDRKVGILPRRSLSVEDIGTPDLVRTVGRVVEVFPDGTNQLELQRPPGGTFGFRVSSGNGRPDTGIYVQEMTDASTAKLYAGLLGIGDEILEVNGATVTGLGLAHINKLLLQANTLTLRVLKHRPIRR
ncbi:uncharacterized protein KIAA1614 homolog isoform X1 [Alligator sinensis]|uniref:Uncharacterized protein KIAA1614 homolog isoform X1 n=2 Tax=Alligator sinensis TaxID=38654 RepID=A0A1U7RT37_ALLSI|nr:uncharacterized protein KIAA1614 homolog isoform X1 [Alligator sinensis]XP_025061958.1 uncharacterized protein KIAA1614 homolog isoform X1 [Alligator sinensis]XP_025061959.1 uncharacterized protein KIAA1614 homolog isoform X1 [Alligator sinensis]